MNLLTATQKSVAQAIVNIFETGSVLGDYSRVTLIHGDTGQLTYGRSQVTLTSGNLLALIDAYRMRPGARFAEALSPFVTDLQAQAPRLNGDLHFHNLLRASADDPVMRDTQDEFFDTRFWATAIRIARRDGLTTPLGVAVLYDSVVHGSWSFIRRRVNQAHGLLADIGEQAWITAYVQERHAWLAGHRRADLRRTTYRMETLGTLIEQDEWMLEMPVVVRRQEISPRALAADPPHVFIGPEPRSREIALASPLLRGLDIRLVQLSLSASGHRLLADGLYGRASQAAVRAFRHANALPRVGPVGGADFDALGL